MKTCKDCNTAKLESEFYKNSHNADGLMSYCKPCHGTRTNTRARERQGLPQERSLVKLNTKLKQPNDGTRICTKCRQVKPEDEFSPNGVTPAGTQLFRSHCKDCSNKRLQDGRKADPLQFKNYKLQQTYKMSYDDMIRMLLEQGGCAVCGTKDPQGRGWSIDHNHACCAGEITCGKCVRGVLCMTCNNMLGCAKDNPNLLRKGADYLERTAENPSTETVQEAEPCPA